MLRRIDRVILRVPNVAAAVRFYRDVLGMKVLREDRHLASLSFADDAAELVLHADPDQPAEAVYYLVEDVRELHRRREELGLRFVSAPAAGARGYRAAIRDPFGNVLLVLDRSGQEAGAAAIEDGRAAEAALFPGAAAPEQRQAKPAQRDLLRRLYEQVGRTADDLPYTPHFENLYLAYVARQADPKPTRQEVWRHLLNLRKAGKLPRLGEARSVPPEVSEEQRRRLLEMLGDDIGKRDRLPYSERFDQIVDEFNRCAAGPGARGRALSPHLVWRLVATLAK